MELNRQTHLAQADEKENRCSSTRLANKYVTV